MQYRKLGKWGIKVSEIGLGSWLTYGASVDESVALNLVFHAVEQGVTFLDTANVYHNGDAEVVYGKAVKQLKRDSVVLATKVFFPMGDGPNDRGLSRKHIFEQCNASLKRLQTDYIDLYQCHRYDPETPVEEIVRTMDDLTRQGKILYWGVSEWKAGQIVDAVRTAKLMNAPPPVSNQPYYNMLGRGIESDVIPTSWREGLGQVVFSPLGQGILTGKYKVGQPPPADSRAADPGSNMFIGRLLNDDNLLKVEKLSVIASDLGLTMSQLALAWILRLDEISSVIIGATKKSHIDENLKAVGVKLSEEILVTIDDILT